MSKLFGGKPDTSGQRESLRRQEEQIASQKQKEDVRLSEADDAVARRKALAQSRGAGRSLLVATSERGTGGTTDKLGG